MQGKRNRVLDELVGNQGVEVIYQNNWLQYVVKLNNVYVEVRESGHMIWSVDVDKYGEAYFDVNDVMTLNRLLEKANDSWYESDEEFYYRVDVDGEFGYTYTSRVPFPRIPNLSCVTHTQITKEEYDSLQKIMLKPM